MSLNYISLEILRDSKDFSLLSWFSTIASKLAYEELRSHHEQGGVCLCMRARQCEAELVKWPITQNDTGHIAKGCQAGAISNGSIHSLRGLAWGQPRSWRRPTGESTMCINNEYWAGGSCRCRWNSGREPLKLSTCPWAKGPRTNNIGARSHFIIHSGKIMLSSLHLSVPSH